MYVEWLLEFVWRLFIQGPLLLINFFTKDNVLNDFTSNIGFNIDNEYGILNSLINVSIVFSFAIVLIIIIFLCKLFKVVTLTDHNYTKQQLISILKEFGKTIIASLMFILVFQLFFAIFDVLVNVINKSYDKALKGNNLITAIPGLLFETITNEKLSSTNNNFLFPEKDFLTKMDNVNFMFSILLVNMFAFFLIWMSWSIYQKFLEIFFLYLSFPVSLAFGETHETINWKIWTKEILNKAVIIFMLMVMIRLYCYFYYFTYTGVINKQWNKDNGKLYISLIVILASGFACIFSCKYVSSKNKEGIGLVAIMSSFNQTRNFIKNTNSNKIYNQSPELIKNINNNVSGLKSEIRRLNSVQRNTSGSLRRVKLFSK